MGEPELFFSSGGQGHYNLFHRFVLVHAYVPMPNTILIQLYYTPGNITRATLELELLRVWPFPAIVLGCRNSSKNRLHTELGCPQTSQQQFRECERQWLQLCGSRSSGPWTNKYLTMN